jgi:uncharacterized YigZ family protein
VVRTEYLTVARPASAEIEVKRSRFLCDVRRVESEEAARAVVEAARRQHWEARHHCSAFLLGPDGAIARSSDDGEPSGTAGAPMLEVLRGAEVSDTVAVVTRWFGGVLLGAGGLVRAYGDAVREALDAAGTLRRDLVTEVALDLPHADAGRVEGELRQRGVEVLDSTWGADVRLLLGTTDPDRLDAVVAELTSGSGAPLPVGTRWVDRPGT